MALTKVVDIAHFKEKVLQKPNKDSPREAVFHTYLANFFPDAPLLMEESVWRFNHALHGGIAWDKMPDKIMATPIPVILSAQKLIWERW